MPSRFIILSCFENVIIIMPNKDHDYLFKVLIIGDYGVGKVDILQTTHGVL